MSMLERPNNDFVTVQDPLEDGPIGLSPYLFVDELDVARPSALLSKLNELEGLGLRNTLAAFHSLELYAKSLVLDLLQVKWPRGDLNPYAFLRATDFDISSAPSRSQSMTVATK